MEIMFNDIYLFELGFVKKFKIEKNREHFRKRDPKTPFTYK